MGKGGMNGVKGEKKIIIKMKKREAAETDEGSI